MTLPAGAGNHVRNKIMDRIPFPDTDNPLGLSELETDDLTVVIVVEHGLVEVGRYHAPAPPERPHPAFERPLNADALRNGAYQQLLGHFPGMSITGTLRVFSCPQPLADKAEWPPKS